MASRREFFTAIGAIVLSGRQQQSDGGRVYDPSRAGRPREPTTAADNDAALQAIEKRLKCSCSCALDIYTCRTTDFTCTYSPQLHKEVVALAEQGKNEQQIIDAFVAQYGEAVLMAPPREGFNLAGYFVPSIAVIVAAVFLFVVLRRWTRQSQVVTSPAPSQDAPIPDATPAELQRLRDELDRLG
jgi:cytochrome c-type biogenesis protein CcmH